jgi:hypothetical protein
MRFELPFKISGIKADRISRRTTASSLNIPIANTDLRRCICRSGFPNICWCALATSTFSKTPYLFCAFAVFDLRATRVRSPTLVRFAYNKIPVRQGRNIGLRPGLAQTRDVTLAAG